MLLPSEQEAMLKLLEAAKVPVKAIKMNPQKQQPITGALQALLSKDPALKVLPAQDNSAAALWGRLQHNML